MLSKIRSWLRARSGGRAAAGMRAHGAERADQLECDRGKWWCQSCSWAGTSPLRRSETLDLEDVRGFTPRRLYRVGDCPECGKHTAHRVGDPGKSIPDDFPMEDFEPQGPCPKCRSEDTIPIIRGYPTSTAMFAASIGRAKLGGCIIINDEHGNEPGYRCCKGCGCEW
jgi:Zn finger protein HypA/HybF involved in hydrogenase expression